MSHKEKIFLHVRLVAKISLAVGTLAVFALAAVLTWITGDSGDAYGQIIRSHSLTRQNLGAAMLVIGLLLIAITGFITWLIALYSGFRIAGPLYRFSQNLQLARLSDSDKLIELRKGDVLLKQAAGIKHAVSSLREHYLEITITVDEASSALAAENADRYADALCRLKKLDGKIKF